MLSDEKKLYEKFWCLLGDRDLMTVFQHFGPPAFRRSSVLEGFEQFIKEQGLSGDCIVEIGSFKGLTAVVLARYFKRVVSIDILDDPDKRDIAALLGIKNIEFITVKNNAEKARIINNEVKFDAAYSDGDHHHDCENDFALVSRCGRVLMHEYWQAQPAVFALVNRLSSLDEPGTVVTKGKFALWTR